MNYDRIRILLSLVALVVFADPSAAQSPGPFGVSASASSFRNHAEWMPKMAAAGVRTVRLFPEWRGIEPQLGMWNFEASDLLVKNAAANKLELNAALMGSPPGAKSVHAFPLENLDDWSRFTTKTVERYKGQVRYWEVWNEGNGGFNDGKHTTEDYAKLAAATYAAAKKADPNARVGLTVASFDPAYLQQTILAMGKAGKAGKPNSFDYLCIHPYEIADGLSEPDGEIPFLWMTRTLREMLRAAAPERAEAEIWITEVGRRIDDRAGQVVTDEEAARTLIKAYTLALAQGIACTQWFEAQDPQGEEAGFGLITRDGRSRASYYALHSLTSLLGPTPKYLGWLALGREGRGYGFVFQGARSPALIAWMPAKMSEKVAFGGGIYLPFPFEEPALGVVADGPLELTEEPLVIKQLPAALVDQAKANAAKPFPWGGDHSDSTTLSFWPAEPHPRAGIVQTNRRATPTVKFADGSTGILLRGDIGHPVSFFVHPSFASLATREYYVRVAARRVGAGNVGMNLIYEVADSQGRSPYANVGQWFGTKEGDGWQTHTWRVTDACFAKMWGFDFSIRPEQSVPFVLGKIEVSTKPFR